MKPVFQFVEKNYVAYNCIACGDTCKFLQYLFATCKIVAATKRKYIKLILNFCCCSNKFFDIKIVTQQKKVPRGHT